MIVRSWSLSSASRLTWMSGWVALNSSICAFACTSSSGSSWIPDRKVMSTGPAAALGLAAGWLAAAGCVAGAGWLAAGACVGGPELPPHAATATATTIVETALRIMPRSSCVGARRALICSALNLMQRDFAASSAKVCMQHEKACDSTVPSRMP